MGSTKKAAIIADVRADRSKFRGDLTAAQADVTAFKKRAQKEGRVELSAEAGSAFSNGIKSALGKYQHLRAAVTDVAALAVRAAGAPAAYQDMADGLAAVTGSAKEASEALDFLAGVSEEQKLEFEPLVEAYHRMRALGYSAEQTRDFIREMGNAIETTGGDAGNLTEVVASLSKIKDKGELTAKALHAMGDSLPFLRKIFKEQFGSETAADIERLNLTQQELFDGIMRGLRQVATNKGGLLDASSPDYLASANRLRLGRTGTGANPLIPDLPQRDAAAADPEAEAARIAAFQKRAADEEGRKAREKAEAGRKELEMQENVLLLQRDIAEAETKGNKEAKALFEDRLIVMQKAADLAKDLQISEEEAAAALLRQNKILRETEELRKNTQTPEQAADMAATRERAAIAQLRSRGKNKEADKRQQALDMKEQEAELIRQGFSPQEAAAMAKTSQQTAEDQAYLDRTGRRKMRGAISKNLKPGEFHNAPVDFGALQDSTMGMKFTALDEVARDRKARPYPNDPGRENPADGGRAVFRDVLSEIKGLRSDVRETMKPAGDKVQPKSSR